MPRSGVVHPDSASGTPTVSRRDAFRLWLKVALHSFGGPAGQIAVIHRLVVEEKEWLSERRFLHALSYCMLLPGPEAQQLATYVGWLLHGVRGGLVAGCLFIAPGFIAILAMSVLYAEYRDVGLIAALFFGLKPAVMAVVFHAVARLGRRALTGRFGILLAAVAFVAIYALGVPFPFIVGGAALTGLLVERLRRHDTRWTRGDEIGAASARPPLIVALRTALVWLTIWLAPLGVLLAVLGTEHIFVHEGVFFSKVAVVTFGGAYAVLSYVAQQAVETYQWLGPGEMLDGLGMAETTPGPLIQVVQFVGFMGAYRHAGDLGPLTAGIMGSVVTTWVTFVPCFMFIFVGAPFVEHLRNSRPLNAALRAITAAVVGVVLNLAAWFSLHTVFAEVSTFHLGMVQVPVPDARTIDWRAAVISAAAMVAMFRYKIGMMPTLGGAALGGAVLYLTT